MAAAKLPNHVLSKDQKPLIRPIDRNRKRQFGTYSYKPEYAKIIYKMLSESDTAKTKSHCCHALQCSRPTIDSWMNKYPEFKAAIIDGMEIGKMRWRDRIAANAFLPSAQVNNGLIKLLSRNVYGIEEATPSVVINNTNTNNSDPEEIMRQRGIPIPDIGIEDIDDGE